MEHDEAPCAIDGCAVVGPTMLLPIRICRRDAFKLVGGLWRLRITLEQEPAITTPPPPVEGWPLTLKSVTVPLGRMDPNDPIVRKAIERGDIVPTEPPPDAA